MAFASLAVGEAQKVAPAAVEMRVAEWLDATRLHARGQFDERAASVARWPPDVTRVVVDRVIRDARRVEMPESDRAALRTALGRGLLLHTDIAIAERTSEMHTASGGRTLRVLDARLVGGQRFSIHWGLARLLADALSREPATAPLALTWYRAAAAMIQQWADLGQLSAYLSAAFDALPDDSVLLLYRGSLHQGQADPRVQAYLARSRAPDAFTIDRVAITVRIEAPAVELAAAERFLRRALALDGALAEAHVRLAHVLEALGKPEEALPHARRAQSSPLPEYLDYYGAMVLGRIADRLGDAAEARAAFERAVARYPRSQAAQVALSRVVLAEGRSPGAVEALVSALGPDADAPEDPWSRYFRVHEPPAAERLEELRRSVP
jgi:tetratricopeptide (TPR) repeat protein